MDRTCTLGIGIDGIGETSLTNLQGFLNMRSSHSIVILFSHPARVSNLSNDSNLQGYVENGQLTFLDLKEWKRGLQNFCQKRPLSFFPNFELIKYIEGSSHPEFQEIPKYIFLLNTVYCEEVKKCRLANKEYYRGQQFQNRLREIAEGAPPRIYIDHWKWPLRNVQKYLTNAAAAFHKAGAEVMLQQGSTQEVEKQYFCMEEQEFFCDAAEIDCYHFRPDLIVKNINTIKHNELVDCPALMLFEDPQAYKQGEREFGEEHLGEFDLIYSVLGKCVNTLYDVGINRDQIIEGLSLIEDPVVKPDESVVPQYDIGFARTLYTMPDLSLADHLFEPELQKKLDKTYLDFVKSYEEGMLKAISENFIVDLDVLLEAGKNFGGVHTLGHYFLNQTSYRYINALSNENFKLSLTGKNWEKVPHLKEYARGYTADSKDYQARFLENKINISINPFIEDHPRVFEGGRLGAFFLILKIPDECNGQKLPSDMKQGMHFDYFSSPEELIAKCHHYLGVPELRAIIGKNLMEYSKKLSYKSFTCKVLDRFRENIRTKLPSV